MGKSLGFPVFVQGERSRGLSCNLIMLQSNQPKAQLPGAGVVVGLVCSYTKPGNKAHLHIRKSLSLSFSALHLYFTEVSTTDPSSTTQNLCKDARNSLKIT